MNVIGTNPNGLTNAVGEGIFGYGTPDGSLGRSAFIPPATFGNRRRQGVFWTPYSYMGYEARQPELQWALMNRPGVPLYPGSYGRGLVLVGPAMGNGGWASTLPAVGVLLASLAAVVGLGWYLGKR